MARTFIIKSDQARPASLINYGQELNDEQRAVVNAGGGPLLVIAGAGSGKTRTLTYRVARLIELGVAPGRVLLVTFTNRAAREMLSRVEALLKTDTRKTWGGTFHSIGNRILRRHAELLGWRQGFSILDREDQADLLKTVIDAAHLDTGGYKFPKAEVVSDILSLANNMVAPLDEIIATRYPYFEEVAEAIHTVRDAYEAKKRETNSMDFDDLLVLFVRLLRENPEVLERYRTQFEFVLVDEYQDTNQLQCNLIDLLVGDNGNLMAVGDDAQSIYSWRGAEVGNMLEFQHRYPRARVCKIETNYRSVPEVLALANAAIEGNRGQIKKTLHAAREGKGMLPALVKLDTPSAQAAFVAQRITELQDEGVDLNEIAVLYRAHFHSLEIQMELTQRGIPFTITSGLRFFEQAHVKDVACFMKFAVNRADEVSFLRMARLVPGIGNTSAMKLWSEWSRCEGATVEKLILQGFRYLQAQEMILSILT